MMMTVVLPCPVSITRVRELERGGTPEFARLPIDDKHYMEQTGVPWTCMAKPGFTANEQTGARPTLDVNGLLSGFTGEGSKTVIPAWAMAKLSTRLVPDQDPEEVHQQICFDTWNRTLPMIFVGKLKTLAGNPASISDRNNPGVQAMAKALETVWGKRPYFKREGRFHPGGG